MRTRLILAFLALVLLVLSVGVTSYAVNRRIQADVAELRTGHGVDLRRVDMGAHSVEVEGFWDPSGFFVATDVEVLPGRRRPKLRGEIQELDREARTLRLYGVSIGVTDATEFADGDRFEDLRPGQRIEVTSSIGGGRWTARKISTHVVKASDKIKGVPTAAEIDGIAPETLELHGIVVSLAPPRGDDSPEGAWRRIQAATRMTLLLQECRAAAHEMLGRARTWRLEGSDDLEPTAASPADRRLADTLRDFGYYLERAQRDDAAGDPRRPGPFAPWLRSLAEARAAFGEHVTTLRGLARSDPERAQAFLDGVFEPFLQNRLLPGVYAYRGAAEEVLADRLHAMASRTGTTMRVALVTSGVAVVLSIVLGLLVWRSIANPIRALHAAALSVGRGHLDHRVEVRSRDELGVLGEAFNRMAGQLAATTVSVSSLENVLDSMAGALLLIDPDGRITRVNRAALGLLRYGPEELVGRHFDEICRSSDGQPGRPLVEASDDGIVASEEKVFLRRDGTTVPVSFSGAALRSPEGPLQGYVCVAQDQTERKRIEEQLRASLAEKELLLREIHHRVKNNMQVVSSLLAIQSSQASDPQMIEKLGESERRIRSMALIHEQLYRSSSFNRLDLRPYLELLVANLVQSMRETGRTSIDLRVEELSGDVDLAIACGLIVNELVTNALKHAFPSDHLGEVRVSLSQDEAGNRVLHVADNGCGLPAGLDPDESPSLGLTLVRQLARQFHGRLAFANDGGTEVTVVFPQDAAAEVRPS